MRMIERKTTIFCSCHLFVRGWAVLLHKLGTFLGKVNVLFIEKYIDFGRKCSFAIKDAPYLYGVCKCLQMSANRAELGRFRQF